MWRFLSRELKISQVDWLDTQFLKSSFDGGFISNPIFI